MIFFLFLFRAVCSKLTVLSPPEGGSKGDGFEMSSAEGSAKDSKIRIAEIDGKVFSSELPHLASVLKANNSRALTTLSGNNDTRDASHGVGANSAWVASDKFSVQVDGEKSNSLPSTLVSFLNDVLNV